ncbi:unnamed protein product [Cyprideis torosa]|uniref:Translocon-associated protein subunit alpha n=1 Tax=Cyprideis torosa TaxID=163714 RepID=A0A7R8W4P7_9CRUS|nr:unnamed protein product [Cyprideis torosa]CAG0879767.1 unnamed protein product [Cyprideis torosa]
MKWLALALFGCAIVLQGTFVRSEDGMGEEEADVESEMEYEEEPIVDDADTKLKSSTEVDTTMLFTHPVFGPEDKVELIAGKLVEILVGFTNKGIKDYVLETMDASFRYPMDYSFYLQNFSAVVYNHVVKPKQEATLLYSFIPSDAFESRSFGLTVNLLYRDLDGQYYQDAVFNKTVPIVEANDGLDTETFFLYVFLAALCILLLVLGHHFLSSFGRKRKSTKKEISSASAGSGSEDDVDYDWIPQETLNGLSEYPGRSFTLLLASEELTRHPRDGQNDFRRIEELSKKWEFKTRRLIAIVASGELRRLEPSFFSAMGRIRLFFL